MGLLLQSSLSSILIGLLTRSVASIEDGNFTSEFSTCLSNVSDPYGNFSTKTSYYYVDNEDVSVIEMPGCEAKSFWLLARHGTRTPGDDDILFAGEHAPVLRDAIVKAHRDGKGNLCPLDVAKFSGWKYNLTESDKSSLTDSGYQELVDLGRRYRQRLPVILDKKYSKDYYQFRFTHKRRTKRSAKGYAEGAFPGEKVYMPKAIKPDPLLRFYDSCEKWIYEVDENFTTYKNFDDFKRGEEFRGVLERVRKRLFGDSDEEVWNPDDVYYPVMPVDEDNLYMMYDLCRYEKAYDVEDISVWCSVFEKEDLEVLEYHQELKYWWKSGYANDLNEMVACPLIKDLYRNFRPWTEDQPRPSVNFSMKGEGNNKKQKFSGTFYFSHSEALLPFLTLLGLYRDDSALTSNNFAEMRTGRKYRTSEIGSFSTNVAFVLFECPEEISRFKVKVLHQERPVVLEGCEDDGVCDWNMFVDKYQEKIRCAFDDICENHAGSSEEEERSAEDDEAEIIEGFSGESSGLKSVPSLAILFQSIILSRFFHRSININSI